MKFPTQYVSDMLACAKSKLAAASLVSQQREYYGTYNDKNSTWHIHQLILYIFLIERWNNWQGATNALTETGLSHIFDRIIRMPYPCILQIQNVSQAKVNRPPIVSGGPDQNLSAGITSTTLAGTVTDPDGDSFTTVWTKLSGGNVTINSPNSVITSLTNMQPGTYVFQLTATDSKGASASATMQVAIASALDTIYYWADVNPFPGTGQAAYIQAGSSILANGASDVTLQLQNLDFSVPKYVGLAIPNRGTNYNKNKWYVDQINRGNMGAITDLFGAPQTITVSGTDYLVWNTNYQTAFTNPCTFKKV